MCPPLFKDLGKMLLFCNLVAVLEKFENAKMNRKIHISGNFRRSKFQSFAGEHAPRNCRLLSIVYSPPGKVSNLISRNPAKVPLNLCAPTFIKLPMSLPLMIILCFFHFIMATAPQLSGTPLLHLALGHCQSAKHDISQ